MSLYQENVHLIHQQLPTDLTIYTLSSDGHSFRLPPYRTGIASAFLPYAKPLFPKFHPSLSKVVDCNVEFYLVIILVSERSSENQLQPLSDQLELIDNQSL